LKGEYFDSDGDGPAAQNRGLFERDSFDFSIDNEGFYETEVFNVSLKTEIDVAFGDGQITNIFGYRDTTGATDSDIDSTPLFIFHSDTDLEQDQISNELRYNGTFDKFEVTTGLYYFQQDVAYNERRNLPTVTPATFFGGGFQDHTVFGAFAAFDYAATDALTLTAGLRYSDESKDGGVTFVIPRAACSVLDRSCPTNGGANGFTDDISFSNWSPKVGLTYDYNDTSLFYANYSKGFRSGGFNFRITNPAAFAAQVAQTGSPTFDEEEIDNLDFGLKYQSDDRNTTLNIGAFLTKVDNFQREVNVASAGAGVSQFILNTAEATIKGLEIPSATYGVGFIHDADLGDSGSIVSRANFQHRNRFAYTDNNFGFVQAADIIDANVTWNTPVEGVSLSLYGKNLLDEVQVGGDTQLPFGGALSPAVPGSQNLANGVNSPFDVNPGAGTFSPLKKGRVIGVELTIRG